MTSSLVCTHCARSMHLSCRQDWCQCPCRQTTPILREISDEVA